MPIRCDVTVYSLTALSGFLPRIGVRGRLYAGMTVCGHGVMLFTA